MTAALLRDAAAVLAALDDDHAEIENGRGYSKADGGFGHALAATPPEAWTPDVVRAAWEMLRRYRGQLSAAGIDVDAIPEPSPAASSRTVRAVSLDPTGRFVLRFSYDPTLVDAVKRLPGRRWEPEDKVWTTLWSTALVDLVDRHGFGATADARAALDAPSAPAAPASLGSVEQAGPLLVLRTAYDAELVAAIRTISGRRWDATARVWVAPLSSISALAALAERFGLDWRVGDVDETPAGPTVAVETIRGASVFVLRFDYDRDLVAEVRDLPGAEWSRSLFAWVLPISAAVDVLELALRHDVIVDASATDALAAARDAHARIAESAATDADLDVPGLGGTLLPFQRAGVAYALRALGYTPDDTGRWSRPTRKDLTGV